MRRPAAAAAGGDARGGVGADDATPLRAAWARLIERRTREDRRLWRAVLVSVGMIAFAVVMRI